MFGSSFGQASNDVMPAMSPGYVRMPAAALDNNTAPALSSSPLLVFPAGADSSKGVFAVDSNAAGNGTVSNPGMTPPTELTWWLTESA